MSIVKISSILFAIVSLMHLARIVFNIEVLIDGVVLPIWVSIVGFIVPAILSVGLWKKSKQ